MSKEKNVTVAVTVDEVQKVDDTDPEISRGPAHDAEERPLLPQTDGGREAFLFMLGAFMVEAIMWGFPLTFGVFQSYYSKHPHFQNSKYISVVGALATGIPFLGAPIITPITVRYHRHHQHMIWTGWVICSAGLLGASFSRSVWHLILTQGFVYGIGFLILYYPLLSMLNEWFVKRRGFAYGVLFAATGLSGIALPFLMERLLTRYGFATTLRAYAVAIIALVGPLLPLLRGRLPSQTTVSSHKIDFRILKRPVFIILAFSNLFQGLAFYIPSIYLPSYATAISISSAKSVLLLSLLNVSQIIGQITMGYVSDHVNVHLPNVGSTISSAIIVYTLWLLAKNFGQLLAFSLCYGLFAGGYSVLYPRFVTTLTEDSATGLWLYGIFAFERGLGNVVAGPISGLLLQGRSTGLSSDPSAYKPLIIFVGSAFIVSGFGGVGWAIRRT